MGFFSLLMSAVQTLRRGAVAIAFLVQELWAAQTVWTKENTGNRAVIDDLPGYLAGIKTTTANETAERLDYVLPDTFTIDVVINKTAAWTHAATGAFLQFLADADVRNAGLQNFASSGTEDAYSVLIFKDSVQIYEINNGSYSQRGSQAITLAEGLTTFRIRVLDLGAPGIQILVYQGTDLRLDYTDATPPAGLGTGLLVGFSNAQSSQKAHMGTLTLYDGDLGAP